MMDFFVLGSQMEELISQLGGEGPMCPCMKKYATAEQMKRLIEAVGGTAPTTPVNGPYATAEQMEALISAIGGGLGGLECETGSWTPEEDVTRGEISFANEHTTGPVGIILYDTSPKETITNYSNILFGFIDAYQLSGDKIPSKTTIDSCAYAYYTYLLSAPACGSYYQISHDYTEADTESGSAQYTQHWATKAKFWPSSTAAFYWRQGRTYKWIAVWKP